MRMKTLFVGVLLSGLACSWIATAAADQTERPKNDPLDEIAAVSIGEFVGGGLAKAAEGAASFGKNAAEASNEIDAARKALWSQYPNGARRAQAEAEFARKLYAKDLYFLTMARVDDRCRGGVLPKQMESLRNLVKMAGGEIDGGLADGTAREFCRWVEAARGKDANSAAALPEYKSYKLGRDWLPFLLAENLFGAPTPAIDTTWSHPPSLAPSTRSAAAATSFAPDQTGPLRREAVTPSETPDQQLQRLTTLINSPSLSADARRQALRERAFLNATTGRLGFAHQDVDALLALDPRDPEAHFARGLAFFVGNPPHAVRAFSQVIEIEPKKIDAYRGRAWTNLVAGEYAAATKDFEQVLLLEPDDAEAYRGRGWAHLHGKNYDQAIKDFTELMRRSPGHPEASAVRGIAYYLSGRLTEARADYRSTIRYGRSVPSRALTFNTLILDDWQRYRRVLALLADKTDIDGLLASAVAGSGLPAFDQAVKINPDDVDARMLRALFQAVPVAGTSVPGYSPPSAITDLSEVIRLRPDYTEAYFWRAVFRAQEPDPKALASAIEDCEKALSVSPGDPAVGALLQKLKIEQRARERSAEQAALARAQFEQNKEAYAVAFLIALVAMFGSPAEPPDPFRRSLLDDMRMWRHFTRPCVNSRGQRC
jgi:tetratricopeptide (TPR) repeat protein